MQCAAYGLSTDRLTPTPSTSAAMLAALTCLFPKTQPLDMMLSMCTQLLWSTMARPVLSGTCPVIPLYSLGRRAVAQFQNFLPWGAMLNFQWPVWESESDNIKFNTHYPHSHLRPNLDIFTQGCTHFCGQRFRHYWLCVELFWGDSKFTLLYKLYTHYFTL